MGRQCHRRKRQHIFKSDSIALWQCVDGPAEAHEDNDVQDVGPTGPLAIVYFRILDNLSFSDRPFESVDLDCPVLPQTSLIRADERLGKFPAEGIRRFFTASHRQLKRPHTRHRTKSLL